MLSDSNPAMASFEEAYDDPATVKLSDLDSKIILSVLQGGDKPWETVMLDRESRQYFHLRAVNVREWFDEKGNKKQDETYHKLVRCSEKSMVTGFAKTYLGHREIDYLYCLEDETVEL